MTMQARKYSLAAALSHEPSPIDRFESATQEAQASQPQVCSFCFGSGMEVISGKGARRCRCRTEDARSKLLEQARIPRRYAGCSLSNYRPAPNNGTQLQAYNLAFKLVNEYPAVDRGLLLAGNCGVGKTHPCNYPCRADSCATRDRHGH